MVNALDRSTNDVYMKYVLKQERVLTTWVVKISRSVARNFLDDRSDDLFICSCLRS